MGGGWPHSTTIMNACRTRLGRGGGGGPRGQGAHPVQLLLRPRTLGIELGLNQAGLRGILIRSARVIKNPTMQCLTVVSYGATGAEDRRHCDLPSTSGPVLNKTVWVLNNFFEILSEQFIIIRQGQVPIEVG